MGSSFVRGHTLVPDSRGQNFATPEQKVFERKVEAAGGAYHVVRSIEDVQALGCSITGIG